MGIGNPEQPGRYQKVLQDKYETPDNPAAEYVHIGMCLGNFMWTLRLSMGDFSVIGGSIYTDLVGNITFWIMWFFMVAVTNIVFLNFIVAEACASYSKVVDSLDQVIQKEMGSMIDEADEMIPGYFKNS